MTIIAKFNSICDEQMLVGEYTKQIFEIRYDYDFNGWLIDNKIKNSTIGVFKSRYEAEQYIKNKSI